MVSGKAHSAFSLVLAAILTLLAAAPLQASGLGGNPIAPEQTDQGFYSEVSGYGQGFGFVIPNIPDGPQFYSVFVALGGVSSLGYPVSSPYTEPDSGDMHMPLQRGLLVWHKSTGEISLANVFELLDNAGLEQWLYDRGIPRAIKDDGGATFQESRDIRLTWLTDPGIHERYMANPLVPGNVEFSILLYGLPMSRPERIGPFIVQRFQRTAFQRWVDTVPGQPAPGTVTKIFAGDLYKDANLIPLEAFRPVPNPFDKPSDTLLAEIRELLASQPETAPLVSYLDDVIVGYAPDLQDTAALRIGNWVLIYLHPALKDARYEAVAAVLAHLATYLQTWSLSTEPLVHNRETCRQLVTRGLRVEAALWEALWGAEGTYNAKSYEEILNGYVRDAQLSENWAENVAEIHCT